GVCNRGELVAVAPMFSWGYGGDPEIIRVSFLGSGITDYLGMTADPKFVSDAARLVLAWLADRRGDWQLCDFQELRAGSPLLQASMPAGLCAEMAECSVCPVAAAPASMEELESRLGGAFRH